MPAFPMLFLYVAGWHTMLFDIAAVCFHIYSHFLACCFCVCFSLCAFPFLLPYAVLSFVSLLFHPIQHHIHTMFAASLAYARSLLSLFCRHHINFLAFSMQLQHSLLSPPAFFVCSLCLYFPVAQRHLIGIGMF